MMGILVMILETSTALSEWTLAKEPELIKHLKNNKLIPWNAEILLCDIVCYEFLP